MNNPEIFDQDKAWVNQNCDLLTRHMIGYYYDAQKYFSEDFDYNRGEAVLPETTKFFTAVLKSALEDLGETADDKMVAFRLNKLRPYLQKLFCSIKKQLQEDVENDKNNVEIRDEEIMVTIGEFKVYYIINGEHLVVDFQKTGRGIPEDIQDRAFMLAQDAFKKK